MCCAVAAKSSYRHASKIPHSLRQIGLSYRGFGKLWSAFGSRSEEHTSELQSLMRISYAVFCLKKKKTQLNDYTINHATVNQKYRQHITIYNQDLNQLY